MTFFFASKYQAPIPPFFRLPLVLRFFLFLLLLAGSLTTWAQCTITPPPCAEPFTATDVATGQPVQALCVGRAVRFAPGCGRTVPNSLLYYNVLPTTPPAATTPERCDFVPGRLPDNTYTPQAAGTVTVSELANPSGGGSGTVFVRNFVVYGSPAPAFTLAACLGNQVALTIGNSGYDQYFAQVGSGPLVGPLLAGSTTTLPSAPAGSSLTVSGRYVANGLCGNQASQVVPALAAPQTPVLGSLTVAGGLPGSIALAVSNLPDGYQYDVQVADAGSAGGFRPVAPVPAGSSSVALSGAAGQYRLRRLDACGNQPAYSTLVPTIALNAASLNNVNTLSWQTAGLVAGYTVLRDGTALATLPATARSYADAAVTCGTRYTYQVQATLAGGSTSLSAQVAVQTVSALAPPALLLVAGFDLQNRVVLTASLPGGAALPGGSQLLYSRQGGTGALDFGLVPVAVDTLRDPTPLATLLDTLQATPPCYTVLLQDVCGNRSAASQPGCPVLLQVAAADFAGNTARLSWTAFRGPGSPGQPASYRVLTLAPNGAVLTTSAAVSALDYLDLNPPADRQLLRYRVAVSGAGLPPGQPSYSNVATLTRQPRLLVPDAFTPNGDGLNDVLEIKGRFLGTFDFVLVDRNGQEVFRATDRSQTWDGTINGHAPVNAAYVWRLTMLDEAGQEFTRHGTVSVLK